MKKATKTATSATEVTPVISAINQMAKALENIGTRLDRLENNAEPTPQAKAKAKVAKANAAKPESIPVLTEEHANGKPIIFRLPSFKANKAKILDAFRNKGFDAGCRELLPHLPDTNDKVAYNIEYHVGQRNKKTGEPYSYYVVWLNVVE